MQASSFKKDVFDILSRGEVERVYKEQLEKKISQLTSRLHNVLREEFLGEEKVWAPEIVRYFRSNKQCKLPWILSEVRNACEAFRSMTKENASIY